MEFKTKAQELGITEFPYEECDDKGNVTYLENSFGYWVKKEYNQKGQLIYFENNNGYWEKYKCNDIGYVIFFENIHGDWFKAEYDSNGNETYFENYTGYWRKGRFNKYDNQTYYENSDGHWWRKEFNENENLVYCEDSNGIVEDNRPTKTYIWGYNDEYNEETKKVIRNKAGFAFEYDFIVVNATYLAAAKILAIEEIEEDYKRSIGGWTSSEREDRIKTVMECNPVIVEKNTAKIVNHSNE